MIEHVLSKPSPSLNRWQSMHWRKRNEFIHNMTLALVASHGRGAPSARVMVTIKRFSNKQLDPDNLVGGCKGILDAIVHAGLAIDDTSQWMARRYGQHRTVTTANRRTVITIEPATQDAPTLEFYESGWEPRPEIYQRSFRT